MIPLTDPTPARAAVESTAASGRVLEFEGHVRTRLSDLERRPPAPAIPGAFWPVRRLPWRLRTRGAVWVERGAGKTGTSMDAEALRGRFGAHRGVPWRRRRQASSGSHC